MTFTTSQLPASLFLRMEGSDAGLKLNFSLGGKEEMWLDQDLEGGSEHRLRSKHDRNSETIWRQTESE